jgi:Fe-S cluster biogenesis protein NfuA
VTTVETVSELVEQALAQRINPMLKAHGGAMRLISIERGHVRLEFQAACVGCALRPMTLVSLIEPALEGIDGIVSVDAGVPMSTAGVARLRAAVRAAATASPTVPSAWNSVGQNDLTTPTSQQ